MQVIIAYGTFLTFFFVLYLTVMIVRRNNFFLLKKEVSNRYELIEFVSKCPIGDMLHFHNGLASHILTSVKIKE